MYFRLVTIKDSRIMYNRMKMSITNRQYLVFSLSLFTSLLLSKYSIAQYQADSTYFGLNNYIEYHAGDLPIIISAPHGGYLEPASIPDRVCGGCVTGRDSWTEELAYKIDSTVRVVFGGTAHIIINKLARKKLDANREIVEAAVGDPNAEIAWNEYHNFIQAAKDSCIAQYGSAIYIDLHSHGHIKQRIELGYLLTKTELQLTDASLDAANFQDSCSIKHLKNVLNPTASFSNMLRGSDCMGELLENRGYPSVPSASDPAPLPADAYFNGGYNTARHGSRDSSVINGIQFETNYTGIRNTNANRNAFARGLACVLKSYLDQWYFNLDTWDPGNIVTTTSDAGIGSLRSALLGAEDGDTITFSPLLNGDTIRLTKEIQICSDIVIKGPGSNLLAISGEDTTRILRIISGSDVEISGLSFINGKTPPIEDGGAVWTNGNVQFTNCVFANNYATDDGGAISIRDSATIVRLDSCILMNNNCGDDGAAIRCFDGTLIINASTIKNNVSPSFGGGLSSNGIVTIANSTFSENEANSGGGIRNFGTGIITCTNTTFSGSTAGYRGAGISTAAQINLNFCTVVNNVAASLGGGIRVTTGGSCTLQNTLVANNTGSGGNDVSMFSGAFVSNGNNFIGDTTGSSWMAGPFDQLGNTLSPLNPQILPLGTNGGPTETIALLAGSSCINNADGTGAPLFDQRGKARIIGPNPDIGAYEFCIHTTGLDIRTACNSFTWIDGNIYSSNNNTATYLLNNAVGCDSTVTLNLTIVPLDTSIIQNGDTLSANLTGASYKWLDCTNGMAQLVGETNQFFTPTLSGSFAVEITQNGCTDTSSCYSFTTVGLARNDFENTLTIFPNPTTGKLSIDLNNTYQSIVVKIVNSIGQNIQTREFTSSQKIDIDITGPSGLYFLEVITGMNKRGFFKVLKE